MRKAFKRAVFAGMLAGLAYAVWRAIQARVPAPANDVAWDTAPFPFPPVPRPGSDRHERTAPPPSGTGDEPATWVEPVDGACPASHPVKAKLSSGIFHVPGGQNYDRTHADRCYVDEGAATADGLPQVAALSAAAATSLLEVDRACRAHAGFVHERRARSRAARASRWRCPSARPRRSGSGRRGSRRC